MDRGIVQLNRHLTKKWDMKMQIEHRERINSLQKTIDNKPPPSFRHLEFKPKKVQLQEGKFAIYNLYSCRAIHSDRKKQSDAHGKDGIHHIEQGDIL